MTAALPLARQLGPHEAPLCWDLAGPHVRTISSLEVGPDPRLRIAASSSPCSRWPRGEAPHPPAGGHPWAPAPLPRGSSVPGRPRRLSLSLARAQLGSKIGQEYLRINEMKSNLRATFRAQVQTVSGFSARKDRSRGCPTHSTCSLPARRGGLAAPGGSLATGLLMDGAKHLSELVSQRGLTTGWVARPSPRTLYRGSSLPVVTSPETKTTVLLPEGGRVVASQRWLSPEEEGRGLSRAARWLTGPPRALRGSGDGSVWSSFASAAL